MSESQYPTGVYVKGDSEKVANTAARAVALAFDGYKLKDSKVEASSDLAPEQVVPTPIAPTPRTLAVRPKAQEGSEQ